METIFKVNDTVYHWNYGKGQVIVVEDVQQKAFPITVKFDNIERGVNFTPDGRNASNEPPTLSFKPYDFVKGGFSQQRPLKVDTLVYVRDEDDEDWQMQFFSHFDKDNGIIRTFIDQKKSTETNETVHWAEYKLTNPLLEE